METGFAGRKTIRKGRGAASQAWYSGATALILTLTGVSMADDLKSAKVYFSVLGEDVDPEEVQGGLQSAKGFIKREIGRRLELRYVPDLEFRHDPSLVRGVEMEKLLESLDPDEPGEGEV